MSKSYATWFKRTKEMLRCRRINPKTAGYNLLLYGICEVAENRELTESKMYEKMQKNCMVPILDFQCKRPPAKQHMVESLRAVGISEEPWEFIQNYISEMRSSSLKKAV